jgi:hypothetical protein
LSEEASTGYCAISANLPGGGEEERYIEIAILDTNVFAVYTDTTASIQSLRSNSSFFRLRVFANVEQKERKLHTYGRLALLSADQEVVVAADNPLPLPPHPDERIHGEKRIMEDDWEKYWPDGDCFE